MSPDFFVSYLPDRSKDQNEAALAVYRRFMQPSAALQTLPVTRLRLEAAAAIRATTSLTLADARHLASCVNQDCNSFITNDESLKAVASVNLKLLADVAIASARQTAGAPSTPAGLPVCHPSGAAPPGTPGWGPRTRLEVELELAAHGRAKAVEKLAESRAGDVILHLTGVEVVSGVKNGQADSSSSSSKPGDELWYGETFRNL